MACLSIQCCARAFKRDRLGLAFTWAVAILERPSTPATTANTMMKRVILAQTISAESLIIHVFNLDLRSFDGTQVTSPFLRRSAATAGWGQHTTARRPQSRSRG